MPDGVRDLVASLEDRQHPFRGASAGRGDWYQGLGVRELADVSDRSRLEIVYWAGCAVMSSPRVASVARSVVTLLQAAGVDFAVVGDQEVCWGVMRQPPDWAPDGSADGNGIWAKGIRAFGPGRPGGMNGAAVRFTTPVARESPADRRPPLQPNRPSMRLERVAGPGASRHESCQCRRAESTA